VHASCIAFGARGVLLRGAPGSGKSDLALRCLETLTPPARLVADDQVLIEARDGGLVASAPERISGLLEVRGVGIIAVDPKAEVPLALIADMAARESVPRLPPDPLPCEDMLGVALPVIVLCPFEASAPVKLRLAVERLSRR